MKHITLAAALVSCACGTREERGARPALCDDLAISAALATELRDQAAAQFASAEYALERADRAERAPSVVDEAGTRPWRHRISRYQHAGLALCESAIQIDQGMMAMVNHATTLKRRDVNEAQADLELRRCPSRTSLHEWAAHARDARASEDALVRACYEQFGGAPPQIRLPRMLLATEPYLRKGEGER